MQFSMKFRALSIHNLPFHAKRTISSLPNKAFIDNSWVSSSSGKTFPVSNPFDSSFITNVADVDVTDAKRAVDSAHEAFGKWRKTLAKERSDLLMAWHSRILGDKRRLAEVMTLESGKPIKESEVEIQYAASFVDWFAAEARRTYGDVVPSPKPDRQILILKQPIGVSAVITPWNFPAAMITRKLGAAFAAGCTAVVKPAEDTPLTALLLAEMAYEVGFPPGVFNVLPSSRENTPSVVKLLCDDERVRKLSFTGSTEVGRILYAQCAGNIKKISLELGGNAPFIVFQSADVDSAVAGLMGSKFRNSGQTCVCSNRIFVHESVHDEFVGKLKARIEKEVVVGNGMDEKTTQGPLVNAEQFGRVKELVESARKDGAKIIHGGEPLPSLGPCFFSPTIITDSNPTMKCFSEEQFGPLVTVCKFKTEQEVLKMANATDRGLAGYFYSKDLSQIWRIALDLEVGMVGVNEALLSAVENAFGGVKQSGLGSEGSKYGIDEYLQLKSVTFGGLKL